MCCDPVGESESEVNGVCPECGGDTVDGRSTTICYYSPVECDLCESAPCDLSC